MYLTKIPVKKRVECAFLYVKTSRLQLDDELTRLELLSARDLADGVDDGLFVHVSPRRIILDKHRAFIDLGLARRAS